MYKIYQIGLDETVDSIAKNFNVEKEEIERINGIKDDMILIPGSFIIIPNSDFRDINKPFIDYEIKKGDTMYELSKKYKTDLSTLLKLNGLNENDYIYPGEIIKIPNMMNQIYITKKGDKIEDIYNKFNIPVDDFIKQNDIYVVEDQLIKYI